MVGRKDNETYRPADQPKLVAGSHQPLADHELGLSCPQGRTGPSQSRGHILWGRGQVARSPDSESDTIAMAIGLRV